MAVDATVRAAARRGFADDGKLAVEPGDLHFKQRVGKVGTLILFVVDASGSMAARRRMETVKSAVLSLLQDAYEKRDQVGVIAFRGIQAEMLLPPTRSVESAAEALRQLPTGGRTPLAAGLMLAHQTLRQARQAEPDLPLLLVLLSDGKANVPLPDQPGDPWAQSLQAAAEIAAERVPALVLDPEAGFVRLGRAAQLASALGAECLSLEQLSAEDLVLKIGRGVSGRQANAKRQAEWRAHDAENAGDRWNAERGRQDDGVGRTDRGAARPGAGRAAVQGGPRFYRRGTFERGGWAGVP